MSVGQKLKALRGSVPQDDVADALGISKSALSMYENDMRVPRDEIKVRIARYFNRSVESIFLPTKCTKRARYEEVSEMGNRSKGTQGSVKKVFDTPNVVAEQTISSPRFRDEETRMNHKTELLNTNFRGTGTVLQISLDPLD